MFQFPFGTMHQLNLDWFLQQWQQLRQDWIDEEQHIDESMQDVYDARDAAIQAKDDAVSAKNDAQTAKTSADADALIAEGFALGEQNGTPVGAGSPYYQANAKFYSTTAGTYRYLSEAYARGTMGGTPVDPGDAGYEDNAKYYKDAADADAQSASDDAAFAAADALKAEGYAVGEQNGVPVSSGDPYYQDNAKYYAAEAQQDKEDADTFKDAANQAALRAEGYSSGTQNGTPVGSGSPYYENNAAWYYGNTANIDGENAQKMISTSEETSSNAAYDHAIGSYFRMSGKLYQAIADIEMGDTITPGTNCEEKTVGNDLNEMQSLFDAKINAVYGKDIKWAIIPYWIDNGYIKNDGTVGPATTYHYTDFIEIDPSIGNIVFTNSNGGSFDTSYNAWYDENKIFISSFSTVRNASIEIVPPSNAKYMRLSFNNTTINTSIVKLFQTVFN